MPPICPWGPTRPRVAQPWRSWAARDSPWSILAARCTGAHRTRSTFPGSPCRALGRTNAHPLPPSRMLPCGEHPWLPFLLRRRGICAQILGNVMGLVVFRFSPRDRSSSIQCKKGLPESLTGSRVHLSGQHGALLIASGFVCLDHKTKFQTPQQL